MIKKVYLLLFLIVIKLASGQTAMAAGQGPASQTITFAGIANQNYGAADFSPGATASSNLVVTYVSSNTAVATIVSGKVHIVGIGTSIITASQAGDGVNFSSATDVPQILTVNPVITFPALTKQFSTTNIAPGATSNFAGATITYTSSDPTVATIIASQIHFVGLGTCTITASQVGSSAANSPYTQFSVGAVLTVARGAQAVLTLAAISKPYQSTDLDPAATSTFSSSFYPISYSSDNQNVATIVNNLIHFTGIGTANITATQAGYTLFADATPKTVVLTVTAPVITFTSLPATKQITNSNLDPAATSTLFAPLITYTSDNPLVATIVNNKIHFIGTGTANITAAQAAGTLSPAPVSKVLTVSAASITLAATSSKPFTTTDFSPGATSTIGNAAIVYTSSNPAVATIVANNVHCVGTGVTTITASQGGVVTPDVTQTLTITPGAITLAATALKQLTNVDLDPAATSTLTTTLYPITYSSSNPAVATIVQNKIHYVGTGLTTIRASQGNVLAPDVSQQLTVTAAGITFAALGSKPFNTTDLVPGATSSITTVPITYTSNNTLVATIVNNNIHYVGVGTATITATQGGIVPDVPNVLTVTQPTLTLAALGTKSFSSTNLDPAAVSTLNIVPIVYTSSDPEVATIVNNKIHYVGAGTTQITASQAGSGTSFYNAPADVNQILTVNIQPVITFTTSYLNKPFNSTDIASASVGATSTVTTGTTPILYTSSDPTVATIVNNGIHYVGVGSTIITASQAAVPGSATPLSQVQQMTVVPASFTFNTIGVKQMSNTDLAPGATSTLSTTAFPITYTSSDPTVATIVNNNIHYIAPGFVTITASQNVTSNYAPASVSQVLVVIPAAITFPVLGTKAISTTDLTAVGATSSISTPAIIYTSSNPAVATIVNNAIHYIGAGTTTITASQGGVVTPDVSQVLTVIPAAISFPALGIKPFNLTDLAPGATSSITTPAITYTSSDLTVVSIVNNAIHFVGIGTATITASQGGSVTPDASQPITVVQPVITFPALGTKVFTTVAALTDVAPGATSTLTVATVPITYTSSNPAVATIVNGLIHYVGLGTTIITASQPAGANYPAPFSQISVLTLTQPTITFAATAFLPFSATDAATGATTTLAGTPLTYTISNPAVVTIVAGKYHFIGLGTTLITASQTDPINPVPDNQTQLLTVYAGPQTLTFPALPTTITYTSADFNPNAVSTGDPVTYTTSDPTIATIVNGLIHVTGVGTVGITASIIPTSGNYAGSSALSQNLVVGKGNQTISIATGYPYVYKFIGDTDVYIPNTSSSGLPLTITISDTTILEVVGQRFRALKPGTCTVQFTQPGNNLYNAAPPVTQVIGVYHRDGSDVTISKALSPNSDGQNDFLYIDGVELYPNNHLVIVNRNGAKVFEAGNYDNASNVFTGKSNKGSQLPEGTYFYHFSYQSGTNNKDKSGFIVLKY